MEFQDRVKIFYRKKGKLTVDVSLEFLNVMGVSKMAGNLYDSIEESTEGKGAIFEKIEEIVDDCLVLYKEIRPNIA